MRAGMRRTIAATRSMKQVACGAGSATRARALHVLMVAHLMAVLALSPLLLAAAALPRAADAANCKVETTCATCTVAKGPVGKCEWCPNAGGSCVESYLQTSGACTRDTVIKIPAKCPAPSAMWTPPPWRSSRMVPSCKQELLTCQHGTLLNSSFCQDIRFLRWPADLQKKHGL